MSTPTLPGWLQVVLVWLCGVVGWLLLRPYRRITQLGGKDSSAAITSAGSWHRRFFRDVREAAKLNVSEPGGTTEPQLGKRRQVVVEQTTLRPEARDEDPSHASTTRPDGHERADEATAPEPSPSRSTRPAPSRTRRTTEWVEPDLPERPPSYTIYRPGGEPSTEPAPAPAPRVRAEAR
ncbi:hypothetical protein Psuf_029650 [Phytohabitans suffuscus]|uniref:Uncharacterized protein n=1 Tax=Phytohabitans suffuscus TaxID=624315 RepID=A0A6F8YHS1_9ACTN|nr:hypothetical protein Psuf_029650 [Phytohabitans suffuscus]